MAQPELARGRQRHRTPVAIRLSEAARLRRGTGFLIGRPVAAGEISVAENGDENVADLLTVRAQRHRYQERLQLQPPPS